MGAFDSFDFQAAGKRIAEENRAEDERIAQRRSSAVLEARSIAAALRERDPSIRAIWGFGSTFDVSRPYRLDSDIDLAIEGGDLLRLFAVTEGSSYRIDLVDIAGHFDEFANSIRARGVPL
jgi:hypothetical protein